MTVRAETDWFDVLCAETGGNPTPPDPDRQRQLALAVLTPDTPELPAEEH